MTNNDTSAIDFTRCKENFSSDRELFSEMIEVFFRELPGIIIKLENSVKNSELEEGRCICHDLKSSLATFAANKSLKKLEILHEIFTGINVTDNAHEVLLSFKSELIRFEREARRFEKDELWNLTQEKNDE